MSSKLTPAELVLLVGLYEEEGNSPSQSTSDDPCVHEAYAALSLFQRGLVDQEGSITDDGYVVIEEMMEVVL